MYNGSSSSSSSQGSMGPNGGGLTRYGSAPGSFLSTAVDSVVGANRDFSNLRSQSRFFPGADTSSLSSDSSCKATQDPSGQGNRSYGANDGGDFGPGSSNLNLNCEYGGGGSLIRHSSLPAGFPNQPSSSSSAAAVHPSAAGDSGFAAARGISGYNSRGMSGTNHGISRLNSQLSFTRQDTLSFISEESENVDDDIGPDNGHRKATHSYATASFAMGSWDDTNGIAFSASPSKRGKNVNGDVSRCLNSRETEFQFSLSQTALDMASMEKYMNIPEDSVPCRTRAKRGCATHPRSIAERERRTRISGKLKKLQELVPNMDKQTSYADMLDLAVEHIKGLQDQVQKLNEDIEGCTCGCKQTA